MNNFIYTKMGKDLIYSRDLFWETKKGFRMYDIDMWERAWFRKNLKTHYNISYSSEFVEISYYNLFCEIVKFEDERYTIILERHGSPIYAVAYSFYHVQLFLKKEGLLNPDTKLEMFPTVDKKNENIMINEYFINSFEVDKEEYNDLRTTQRQKPFSDNEINQLERLTSSDENFKIIKDNIVSLFIGVDVLINIRRFSNVYLVSITDKYGKLYYAFPNFEGILKLVKSSMPHRNKGFLKYDNFVAESYNQKLKYYVVNEEADLKTKLEDLLITASELPDKIKRSWITHSLSLLIGIYSGPQIKSYFDKNPVKDPEVAEVVDDVLEDELEEVVSKKDLNLYDLSDPTQMKLSQEGWDHIKWEEGDRKKKGEPVLKAYKLGDGRITIGWGHAEKIKTSKFKVGQVITKEKAQELLKEDMKIAADGVRRMFKQWKDEGINVNVTQKQFDVLVSIAFNAGVTGLRNSEIVKHLKEGDIQKAGEVIQDTLVGDWAGLKVRREKEKDMWFS